MNGAASKLKAVLVGCGGISRAWLDALRPMADVQVAGFVDLNLAAAQGHARHYGPAGVPAGTDLPPILKQVQPDVVFNCTVPQAHTEVTIAALRHGCHVLGEKPLADTMENARRMIAVARETGKIFAVIQNRRYSQPARRLKRFLESGILGRIGTVHCDFIIGAHFGGFRDQMRHVLILDMAIHTFDLARYLIGLNPIAVLCTEWNPPGSWYAHDASAAALFEMAGGCIYTYRGSWCAEGLNTTWECDWRFIGEHGSVTWNGADGFAAQVVAERGGFTSHYRDVEIPPAEPGDRAGGHGGVIREFLDCVRSGGVPETVCTDNVKSLAMVLAAIASSEQDKRVPVTWE